MSAATSSRSCATCVEIAIALTRERKRKDVAGARRAGRRGARARCAGRRRRRARPRARASASKLRAGELERQGNRDRGAAGPAAACRCSKSPACRARRWARSRSATFSASSAAAAPRRGASRCRSRTRSWSTRNPTSCSIRSSWCRKRSSAVEQNGIVFLDEIDKIAARDGRVGGDVSREGVQRDLLPLIEGTTVVDQARRGEDRPHPVHRVGRVSHLASRPTCCRSCRAGCRSASS